MSENVTLAIIGLASGGIAYMGWAVKSAFKLLGNDLEHLRQAIERQIEASNKQTERWFETQLAVSATCNDSLKMIREIVYGKAPIKT